MNSAVNRYHLSVLGLILCCLLVALWLTEDDRMQAAAAVQESQTIIIGAALYENNCRTCHGARGEGVGQLGPALADKHFFTERKSEVGWLDTLEGYIASTIGEGRLMATRPLYAGNRRTAVMPPWLQKNGGPLRRDEIEAIAHYVMNWQATALGQVQLEEITVPPMDLADPVAVKAGQEAFRQYCQSCHSLKKQAKEAIGGPSLSNIGELAGIRIPELSAADYIRQSVLIPSAFNVEGFAEQADKNGCGAVLSEQHLQSIIAFLLQQHN